MIPFRILHKYPGKVVTLADTVAARIPREITTELIGVMRAHLNARPSSNDAVIRGNISPPDFPPVCFQVSRVGDSSATAIWGKTGVGDALPQLQAISMAMSCKNPAIDDDAIKLIKNTFERIMPIPDVDIRKQCQAGEPILITIYYSSECFQQTIIPFAAQAFGNAAFEPLEGKVLAN